MQNFLTVKCIRQSEWVTNTKQTCNFQSSEQYFKLCVTFHYGTFHMKTEKTKLKGLSEVRFRSTIFLLRMAGVPFQMKKVSTIYIIYMVTVIVCCFSTILGMFVDVYVHWDELGRAMTSIRALFPFTNVMWIFSYFR